MRAPELVQAKLTTSLSIHFTPDINLVGYVPQCIIFSVILLQLGHLYCACIVAPMTESIKAPSIPLITIIMNKLINDSLSGKSPLKVKIPAPMRKPEVPRAVTPPDVPTGTFSNVIMSLGLLREKMPISVPQVSAVAAANDPRNIK